MDHCASCGKEVNEYDLYEVVKCDTDEILQVCFQCLELYTNNQCQENEEEIKIPDLDREEECWRD